MKTTKAKTVDEYIARAPKEVAQRLKTIREIVKKNAPGATEVISYGMPAFKLNVYFAAHKNHIGLYPYPSAIKAFKKDSTKYKTATGSIQFPLDQKLPIALITKIVKYRVKEKS